MKLKSESKKLFLKNNIQNKYLGVVSKKLLSQEFNKVIKNVQKDINDPQKTLSVLNKKFKLNFKIENLKKFKKFKTIVLIGMGGSVLGVKAIKSFLNDKIKKKIYFFDDLNSKKISNLKKKENLNKILFIVISKSGNTIETLSNFFSLKIAKKNSKNIIIISEKKNNILFNLVKNLNLNYIEHKNYVGGRYSVLSEVGMVPAYLMGVNIFKLRSDIVKIFRNKEIAFLKDSAIKLACLLKLKKINNLIFLNYSPKLENFLFWCQQLIAESLGKNGKGFLPVISNAPKDHHSLLQLYLDGPKDKIFHIFSHEEESFEKVNMNKTIGKINFLDKKKIEAVKIQQKNALIKSLKKKKIPYREFKIKKADEENLGKLFSYFILETVIIGILIKVNPFSQPAVEQVKIDTKKLLS